MKLPTIFFSIITSCISSNNNLLSYSFADAAGENIFHRDSTPDNESSRILCNLIMVEFFPDRGMRHIPSEIRCVEKNTKRSYTVVDIPDNVKSAISGDENHPGLINPLVSIPTSYMAKSNPSIIDLKFDSRAIEILDDVDDTSSKAAVGTSKQFQGTSPTVVIRVKSGDGLSPTKTAAQLSDDIFGTNGDVMNLVSTVLQY